MSSSYNIIMKISSQYPQELNAMPQGAAIQKDVLTLEKLRQSKQRQLPPMNGKITQLSNRLLHKINTFADSLQKIPKAVTDYLQQVRKYAESSKTHKPAAAKKGHSLSEYECKKLLNSQGLQLIDVAPDGNCCPRAIARACYPDEDQTVASQRLRRQVVERMRTIMENELNALAGGAIKESELLYTGSLVLKEGQTYWDAMEEYLARLSGREWMGEQELCLLPDIIGRPIWVYDPLKIERKEESLEPPDMLKFQPQKRSLKEPIKLFRSRGNHYEALLPAR